MNIRDLSRGKKLLLTGSMLSAAAGVAGMGTYADWSQSTPSGSQSISSGTLVVGVGNNLGTSTGEVGFTQSFSNVAPGDSAQRLVDVTNTGSLKWGELALSYNTSVNGASPLLAAATGTNGVEAPLAVTVDECSVPWTGTTTNGVTTYACTGGTMTPLVLSTSLADHYGTSTFPGSLGDLMNAATHTNTTDPAANTPSYASGNAGVDFLRFTTSYPSTNTDYADASGKTVAVTYNFTATQRAGQAG